MEAETETNGTSCSETKKNKLDGNYYLEILKTERNRLSALAKELGEEVCHLKDSVRPDKEVYVAVGNVIGQTQLLCSAEMKQFENVCYVSLVQDPGEKFLISGEDLGGFWAKLTLQVNKVDAAFAEIDVFRKNEWRRPRKPKKQKKIPLRPKNLRDQIGRITYSPDKTRKGIVKIKRSFTICKADKERQMSAEPSKKLTFFK